MFELVVKHAADILAVFGILQVIARATPTPKDDEIVTKVGKVLNFVFSKTNIQK